MAKAIREIHVHYPAHRLPPFKRESIEEPPYYIQPRDITTRILKKSNSSKPSILLNFNPDTDPTQFRRKLWRNVCNNGSHSFAICLEKANGVNIIGLSSIYQRNRQYQFWLSPRGNGIDCHRTWEALYLDVIPIVWHSPLDVLYANLPVVIINDWTEINDDFLRAKMQEIAVKKVKQPPIYRLEMLRTAYWQDMILKKSRYALQKTHMRKNRCWRGRTIRNGRT
jgi:hypothetical protein